MKRIRLKGGFEQDMLTGWRKVLKCAGRSGVAKFAKRSYNRRFRRLGRLNLKQEVEMS